MKLNPPASLVAIAQFEEGHDIMFPAWYRQFLRFGNGGALFLPGTNFYGVDPDSQYYSLEKENAPGSVHSAYGIPASLYIVGRTADGNPLCIDFATQEFVEWDHAQKKEWSRWPSVFEFIEDDFESYESSEDEDEDEDEAEEPAAPQPAGGITELHFNTNVMYIVFGEDGGKFKGQTIQMTGKQLGEKHFEPYVFTAEEIPPISREEMCSTYKEIKNIRIIPERQYDALCNAIREYCKVNNVQMDF